MRRALLVSLTFGWLLAHGGCAEAHDTYFYCEPRAEQTSYRNFYNDPYEELHTIHYQLYRQRFHERTSCIRIFANSGRPKEVKRWYRMRKF